MVLWRDCPWPRGTIAPEPVAQLRLTLAGWRYRSSLRSGIMLKRMCFVFVVLMVWYGNINEKNICRFAHLDTQKNFGLIFVNQKKKIYQICDLLKNNIVIKVLMFDDGGGGDNDALPNRHRVICISTVTSYHMRGPQNKLLHRVTIPKPSIFLEFYNCGTQGPMNKCPKKQKF